MSLETSTALTDDSAIMSLEGLTKKMIAIRPMGHRSVLDGLPLIRTSTVVSRTLDPYPDPYPYPKNIQNLTDISRTLEEKNPGPLDTNRSLKLILLQLIKSIGQ